MAQILCLGDYVARLVDQELNWEVCSRSTSESEGIVSDSEVMDFMVELEAKRIAEKLEKGGEENGII